MTLLTDLTKVAPTGEALVRVYETQLTLNAAAKKLLRLSDDSKVIFRVDEDKKLYIGKRKYAAYSLAKVGNGYRIRSTSLCKTLAETLQGYGTYRIEGEDPIRDHWGEVCYSVFPRKYD